MIYCKIHCGLGDMIATAAIINKLAIESGEKIILPCYKHNEESVRSIFANSPNITLDLIDFKEGWPEFNYDGKVFALGHYTTNPQRPNEDFVQWFYRQAGMTYSDKLKWCPVREAAKQVKQRGQTGEYDFIHDDFNRGFNIRYELKRTAYRPAKAGSILQYCSIIENATDIHCIDSSFFHLVECLKPKGKLFYHQNSRPNSTNYNPIHGWNNIC